MYTYQMDRGVMPKSNRETWRYVHNKPWERKRVSQLCNVNQHSEFEENEFLAILSQYNSRMFPAHIRRLRRKLLLRRLKPTLFNREDPKYNLRNSHYFSEFGNGFTSVDLKNESIVGIIPSVPCRLIHCPFTDRKLKPVILRGLNKTPLYLAMHAELLGKVKKKYPNLDVKNYAPPLVSFFYVQPEFVPAINALVNAYFWPLVDMNCILDYKEFSCVAVYRKLIVGFGFMFPGEHLNEGYVSFLFVRPHWRNCGIASFILYHLIQTSYTWDNTLHVSATNPSLFLYQKFGFKFQRMYSGFYNKYLNAESKESRHALYCKLDSGS